MSTNIRANISDNNIKFFHCILQYGQGNYFLQIFAILVENNKF